MRRAILILTSLVCHAFLRDAQGATVNCDGHVACKTNWTIHTGPVIVVDLFGTAGNNAECAIDATRPVEENFLGCVCACSGDKVSFRVTASDIDDHVCQVAATKPVTNFMENTTLSVQITGTGIAATVPLVSDQAGNVASRTWNGSWTVPPDAAGQMLDFQFSGIVEDKPCTSHLASNDPDVSLNGYIGRFAIFKVDLSVTLEDEEINGVRSGLDEDTLVFDLNGTAIPHANLTLTRKTEIIDEEEILTELLVEYSPSCDELIIPGSNTLKVDIDDNVENHMDQITETFSVPTSY